jgi:NADH-quinone oxidoreductase subunit A
MSSAWIYVGMLLLLSSLLPVAPIAMAWVLGPHRADPIKNSAYECGIESVGDAWVQFRAQYYVFALGFVVFDVETVFLFPFAAAFDRLALWAVFEAVIFILLLAFGLVYAWRKGALEWI